LKRFIFVGAFAVVAILLGMAGRGPMAQADSPGPNGQIDHVGLDPEITVGAGWSATADVPPAFFWSGGDGVFSYDNPFTFTSAVPVIVRVTDDFCKGDQFRIYDFGVPIGDTSAVPSEAPACSSAVGPDAAFADPSYSSGSFMLGSGPHSIDIQVIVSPFGGGRGYIKADAVITPALVEEVIFPGGSVDIEKTVQTPVIPPTPDIFFLFDTTGSMGGDIATVQAKLAEIITTVGAQSVDPQYGVAKYEDFPFDPWGLNSNVAYDLLQPITSDTTAVTTAINGLSTFPGSGGDTPEAGYEALYQALAGAGRDLPNPDGSPPDGDFTDAGEIAPGQDAGFRPDASKVILLVGDAAFHFPGDPPTSLQFAAGYPGAGQADVLAAQGDVSIFCLIPAELEGVGPEAQCDALGATSFDIGASSQDIVDAIIAALGEVEVEVSMQSDCTAPITVSFDPASQVVTSGSTATFTETISVAADAPGGTYECDDHVLIDGQPLLDPATGEPVAEHKVIKVPEGFLTGGGQIDTGKGKNAFSISFGGNVGFLADFSLVGQWQTVFHNVSVDSLDKARFHSTAITALQFFQDGGPGPYPPPANANVGLFTATGRLNGEDGWTLDVCLADRGEPGRQNDSIRLRLTNPGGAVVYDSRGSTDFVSEDPGGQGGVCDSRHKLDSGNFQIHSGVKGP